MNARFRTVKQLVFDVGMCNGDDTAYYLHRGYRVVAIEANPEVAARAAARFESAVATSDLTILNVAVTESAGCASFWICESVPEWSSVHLEIASRMGSSHRAVDVQGMNFQEILRAYGTPFYLKVDIEGNDRLCIDALSPDTIPQHISIEMGHKAGIVDIAALYRLGYRRFKCVRQNDLQVIESSSVMRLLMARRSGLPDRISRKLFCPLRERLSGPGGYKHPLGSSGPFGGDLPGRWQSLPEISTTWSCLSSLHEISPSLSYWYDIHAARD